MVSIRRLILVSLFATGAAFGIVISHGAHSHGGSVTPTQLRLAGDNPPTPPGI